MRSLTQQLLLILVILLASCGTTRRVGEPIDITSPSSEKQRKYEYYYLEAIRLEQQEKYDEAFEMLNHCLSIDSAPSALYKIANYYLYLNQKEKAVDALLQTIEEEPDNYWYWQTLAAYYQNNSEYDKAISTLESMQQRFPKRNSEQLSALVGLYSHTRQYEKVIHTLVQLEKRIGKSEAISMEKCRNYLLMGKKEEAFKEMEALANEYPENSYYRVILAEVYMNHGCLEKTEPLLHKVLEEEPDNGAAKVALVQYYKLAADSTRYLEMSDSVMMSINVNDEVKTKLVMQLIADNVDSTYVMHLLERAIAQPQQSARLGHLAVQYMLSMEQPEERIRPILKRMLEIEPDHIHARLQLSAYAARRNDIEELIKICSEGIDYSPETIEFYYYKGLGLYQLGEYEEALQIFAKATELVTKESDSQLVSDIYATMGDLHQLLNQPEESFRCYDSALTYTPDNLVVLNNYAYLLSVQSTQLDKAEQMSLRTIKTESTNATYLDTYAWILYQKGEYDKALIYIEQALEIENKPSDVLYEHAGDICYRLGDKQKALFYWKQALDIQRSSQNINKVLQKKIKEKKM